MLEKIKYFLQQFLFKKHFVFRSQYYFETSVVSDTNVIEYEFINVGRTSVFVNDAELLPVAINVPAGSGIGDIFSRMKLRVNYNEEDTTIYHLRFPSEADLIKTCGFTLLVGGFIPCVLPFPCANKTISLQVGNGITSVQVFTPFVINCAMTLIQIQNLFNANFLPQYAGATAIINSFDPAGISVTISGLNVPFGYTTYTLVFAGDIGCPSIATIPLPLICTIPPLVTGKLLVITKVKAGLKDNP